MSRGDSEPTQQDPLEAQISPPRPVVSGQPRPRLPQVQPQGHRSPSPGARADRQHGSRGETGTSRSENSSGDRVRLTVGYRQESVSARDALMESHKRIWTTYAIADSDGRVRYVGCTVLPLPIRISGHVSAARSNRTPRSRWSEWLRREIERRRPVTIFEIGHDVSEDASRCREFETISSMLASGAPLLNTNTSPRQRCPRCGALAAWLPAHKCPRKRPGQLKTEYRMVIFPKEDSTVLTEDWQALALRTVSGREMVTAPAADADESAETTATKRPALTGANR